MNGKRVAFLSLGCKVNSYETDAMEQLFKNAGYSITSFYDVSDIYIVNTCTVTNVADRKSRQMLHRAKKMNSEGVVVAVGCYAQTSYEEACKDEAIDIVIGNNQKSRIVVAVEEYLNNREKNSLIEDISTDTDFEELNIEATAENTRAFIKIQDGCNQFCSYCIIPYARGRIRSRECDDILCEVGNLAKRGYREVVLTGIHISSYGMDFTGEKNSNIFRYEYLLELIEKIALINGIDRIRLGSLEPRIISEEFIEKLSKIDKLCPHFHLSLQSGCDETLKRMNRRYTTEEFLDRCDILRRYFDRPALTTDVITGFPGETNEEFSITRKFLKKVNFSQMHVFKYSKRKGTVAERMPDQIDESVKASRSRELIEMTQLQHREYIGEMVGTSQLVLFEEVIEHNSVKYSIGHNERYVKIAVEYSEDLENQILEVSVDCVLSDEILLGHVNM